MVSLVSPVSVVSVVSVVSLVSVVRVVSVVRLHLFLQKEQRQMKQAVNPKQFTALR